MNTRRPPSTLCLSPKQTVVSYALCKHMPGWKSHRTNDLKFNHEVCGDPSPPSTPVACTAALMQLRFLLQMSSNCRACTPCIHPRAIQCLQCHPLMANPFIQSFIIRWKRRPIASNALAISISLFRCFCLGQTLHVQWSHNVKGKLIRYLHCTT